MDDGKVDRDGFWLQLDGKIGTLCICKVVS